MGRRAAALLAALVLALVPVRADGAIYEYADADGNVTYYKYTGKGGGVVFSDRLDGIPQETRKRNKIVRIGPPPRPRALIPAEARPPAPAAVEAPAPPTVVPDEARANAPPAAEEEGRDGTIKIILGVGALLVVLTVVVLLLANRREPSRRKVGGGRGRTPLPQPDAGRDPGRPLAAREAPDEGGTTPPRRESPQEALHRHLGAGDFASAARLCESLGRLGEAAGYHREAGNLPRARELYAQIKDYGQAAELFEAAGDDRKAAELWEAQAQRELEESRGASGGESALKCGRLLEKLGEVDHALSVYRKARLFAAAAPIYEQRGDYWHAAESYIEAGDLEKAAALFEKSGDPARGHAALSRFLYDKGRVGEAAEHAAQAGDPVQAAMMFQEMGELSRAGELFLQAGFFDEAAENFAQAGDVSRAAEAFERAGKHLLAAQAFEKSGGDPRRIAQLYENGGEFYAAGRLFVKLGELDRALGALQQVDAASEQYRQASLLIGMIFLKRGNTNLAIEKFSRVIGDRPIARSTLEPYYFLALCHEAMGDGHQARSIFEKILAEDYTYRDVKKRLAGG